MTFTGLNSNTHVISYTNQEQVKMNSQVMIQNNTDFAITFIPVNLSNTLFVSRVCMCELCKQDVNHILQFVNTLTIIENATVDTMAGFREIQMTTIHIQLPKLLSNHLQIC